MHPHQQRHIEACVHSPCTSGQATRLRISVEVIARSKWFCERLGFPKGVRLSSEARRLGWRKGGWRMISLPPNRGAAQGSARNPTTCEAIAFSRRCAAPEDMDTAPRGALWARSASSSSSGRSRVGSFSSDQARRRTTLMGWLSAVAAVAVAGVAFKALPRAHALDNGVALTPPMGWLSWERYLCVVDCDAYPDSCINEKLYTDMADILVSEGYAKLGYKFVNIDDCWMANKRDFDGMLQANFSRFPHGIQWLASYMHSKGLKLGIYQDCGTKTCGGYPGSEGHFEKDADTFARWHVDMLKLDGCYADKDKMDTIYPKAARALNRTGRPIVFSCSWPAYQFDTRQPNYKLISHHCNLWRNYDDIADSWKSVTSIMDYYAKVQDELVPFSGPGAWSDPDMLIIGNFGLSEDQARTQMAIWAILAAPLFISTDLRTIRPVFKEILQNRLAIEINQDPLGIMGRQFLNKNGMQVWIRPVLPRAADGTMSAAIAIHNRYDMGSARLFNASLSDIGMNYEFGYAFTNVFENQTDMVLYPDDFIAVLVNPTGVVMFKATTQAPP